MSSHCRLGVLMCAILTACGGQQAKPTVLNQTNESANPNTKKPISVPKKLTQSELDAVLVSARALVVEGKFGEAERTLENALLQESNDDFVYSVRYNLGVLSERKGDYSKAMRHFEKAQILKPEIGAPVLALAQLYVRQGQASAGIDLARNAL